MPGKDSNPPLRREAVKRTFFAFSALLAVQALQASAAALEGTYTAKPFPVEGDLTNGIPYSIAAAVLQPQPQPPTAEHTSTFSAAPDSGAFLGKADSEMAGSTRRRLTETDDEEDEQTSTKDVDTVCFSRNLSGILDQSTGEFIDQGRSAEEVLAEMKAKSLEPGRAADMEALASMIEDGEFNASIVKEIFPLSAVVFLVVAGLMFVLLISCVAPIVCSYRVDRKALDEATAVVCAGGRSADAVLYGTRTSNVVQGERHSFAGIQSLLKRTRKLADSADGKNPNNIVHEVKDEILDVLSLKRERQLFNNAKAATAGNLSAAKEVTDRAFHYNIFVEKNSAALLKALGEVEGQLGNIDLTTGINSALQNVQLPSADLSGFDDAEELMDMLTDAVESVGSASLQAEQVLSTLDIAILCISAISGAFAVLGWLILVWQLYRPNKCSRRMLGILAILMTVLSVVVCITVAVVSLVHKLAVPVCDYAAVRFIDINSNHPLAIQYGEDSPVFQALSICLSETGSGDLLQKEDGTSQIDPILEKLKEAKQKICELIPDPPDAKLPGLTALETFGDNARLQSWAVIEKNYKAFNTFKEVQESGIQEPDSVVPVDREKFTLYGLGTVRNRIKPWNVVISNSSYAGSMTVTSLAPASDVLDQWKDDCLNSDQRTTIECEKVYEAVLLVKRKIGLMVSEATCYRSSTGSQGVSCTVPELMGGVGDSSVPQNALDTSVIDAVNSVKQAKATVEGSKDTACKVAENKITYINDEVLSLKNGSNCKFVRDRIIRLTSHLCYGAIDGLGTGFVLYFLLAVVMVLFSLLLLVLIVEERDNNSYREAEYTAAAAEDAPAPAQAAPEGVIAAPPEEPNPQVQDLQEETAKTQGEASGDGIELNRASHSEGAHEGMAAEGAARRMASIP
ncbi:hypothetical protein, conserved [Eimeria brunetti]|uniref:Transmembrane protein n=1 Tax=Eimeria brunetti TaxID=51314 RepID=U6LWU8_9EIME|nr:hypothetical protein, conserved [Eimeria brunetti]